MRPKWLRDLCRVQRRVLNTSSSARPSPLLTHVDHGNAVNRNNSGEGLVSSLGGAKIRQSVRMPFHEARQTGCGSLWPNLEGNQE